MTCAGRISHHLHSFLNRDSTCSVSCSILIWSVVILYLVLSLRVVKVKVQVKLENC